MSRKSKELKRLPPRWVIYVQNSIDDPLYWTKIQAYFIELAIFLNNPHPTIEFVVHPTHPQKLVSETRTVFSEIRINENFEALGFTIILDSDAIHKDFPRYCEHGIQCFGSKIIGASNHSFIIWELLQFCNNEEMDLLDHYGKWLDVQEQNTDFRVVQTITKLGLKRAYLHASRIKSLNKDMTQYPFTTLGAAMEHIFKMISRTELLA